MFFVFLGYNAEKAWKEAVYMADHAPNYGLRKIYSNKFMWLRWIAVLAERGFEQVILEETEK